jgi:hypothetical protein
VDDVINSIAGILIPFIGTSLGASFVFFMKKDMNEKFKKLIVGFASRSDDCSKYLVTYYSSSRNVGKSRDNSMATRSNSVLF